MNRIIGEKYELGSLVGEGGSGIVYEARHTWTDRAVALKLLHPEVAADADAVERFLREAKAMGRVRHDNVVEVLDMGQEVDGSLFLVMDLLSGWSLAELDFPLSEKEAIAIAVQLADGILAAHNEDIIHRDLKPDNVMVVESANGRVPKLIDFGIAQTDNTTSPMWQSKVLGTASYMSPEQVIGKPLTKATDVWSFGICLYEMLDGDVPFTAGSPQETIEVIAKGRPPDCSRLNVSDDLRNLLATMFRKPDERPSMQHIASALRALSESESLESIQPRSVTAPITVETAVEHAQSEPVLTTRVTSMWKWAAAAAVALVLMVGAWFVTKDDEPVRVAETPVTREPNALPEAEAETAVVAEPPREPTAGTMAQEEVAPPASSMRRVRRRQTMSSTRRAPGRTGSLTIDDF